jgi:hypothetical protein
MFSAMENGIFYSRFYGKVKVTKGYSIQGPQNTDFLLQNYSFIKIFEAMHDTLN